MYFCLLFMPSDLNYINFVMVNVKFIIKKIEYKHESCIKMKNNIKHLFKSLKMMTV